MTYNDPINNPYDSESEDLEPHTKPLDVIIRDFVQNEFKKLHVWIPARIVKVSGNQLVDVQLLFQSRYMDGTTTNLPIIHNVPVQMPNGADYSIKIPIAVGDKGAALFCDRSIDVWSASDGNSIVDPQDSRAHNISDLVFVPGVVPFGLQTKDETNDMVLTNGAAQLRIQKPGTFQAKNSQNELMDLLVKITTLCQQLSQTLSTDTVNTIFGLQQLNAFETYAEIATELEDDLTKLTTLKGS